MISRHLPNISLLLWKKNTFLSAYHYGSLKVINIIIPLGGVALLKELCHGAGRLWGLPASLSVILSQFPVLCKPICYQYHKFLHTAIVPAMMIMD